LAGLAMHQVFGANYLTAKGRADGLMSEADAQHRNISFGREMPDQFDADARFLWSARSGRNHDALGMHRFDPLDGHFIVAANLNLGAQFAKILDEVVSERIVVIEDEDHVTIIERGWTALKPVLEGSVYRSGKPPRHPKSKSTGGKPLRHPKSKSTGGEPLQLLTS
jgi:hypothetical protein